MTNLSPDQRRMIVEQLSGWVERMVGDERNHVDVQIRSGISRIVRDDLESLAIRPSGAATLTVQINGGVQDAAGPGPANAPP